MADSISNLQSTTFSITVLVILLALIEITIKKYIIVEEPKKISETTGKNINRWVKGLLAFISLFILFFVLDTTNINTLKWFWLISFLVAMGLHAFMDWMYLKGSKEYMISLIKLAVGLIYIFIRHSKKCWKRHHKDVAAFFLRFNKSLMVDRRKILGLPVILILEHKAGGTKHEKMDLWHRRFDIARLWPERDSTTWRN
ncbi:DUF4181 domain-containing protein [Paenibacillus sp. LHD-117]|uniref:DUF4181 domain-containing protein n=1 Tax=Paenibacillus sp. LHD-117 TaxID=3071412 RepID=UPI0027E00A51|nr:DUF4181 domain-containing protein [Paenibacillus sp. LHD-117]MDQ6423470.1 DUF4181 domain-containing protein [Paenibacillus sp. LHD-117]